MIQEQNTFVRSFNQNQDKYFNYYWQENVMNDWHYNDVCLKLIITIKTILLANRTLTPYSHFLKSYHVMNNIVKFDKIIQIQKIDMNQINNLIIQKDGKTFECELSLQCHTSPVEYISQRNNEDLLSCSMDKSIKIWKKKNQ